MTYRRAQPVVRQFDVQIKIALQKRLGQLHHRRGIGEVEMCALGQAGRGSQLTFAKQKPKTAVAILLGTKLGIFFAEGSKVWVRSVERLEMCVVLPAGAGRGRSIASIAGIAP